MKIGILVLSVVVLLQACSAPRYAYYFDHEQHGRDSGLNAKHDQGPFVMDPNLLEASGAKSGITVMESPRVTQSPIPGGYRDDNKPVHEKNLDLRSERKIASHETAATESGAPATGGMDKDLKMAAIFGAAGLVGLLIGGSTLNVLGGIALLVGLVFFVRWLIRR